MPHAALTLERDDREGVQIVRLCGPLDSMTYDQTKDYLEPIVGAPHARVVLDGEKLSYINSRGITLLARYQKMAAASLGFLGIAALNRRICKAIELLGMASLLRLYPTVDDAMKSAMALAPKPRAE
jgi:anti-anti-sigma factor